MHRLILKAIQEGGGHPGRRRWWEGQEGGGREGHGKGDGGTIFFSFPRIMGTVCSLILHCADVPLFPKSLK